MYGILLILDCVRYYSKLHLILLKTELRISDFQHFHWLAISPYKERTSNKECNGNLNICLFADLTPVLRAPRF